MQVHADGRNAIPAALPSPAIAVVFACANAALSEFVQLGRDPRAGPGACSGMRARAPGRLLATRSASTFATSKPAAASHPRSCQRWHEHVRRVGRVKVRPAVSNDMREGARGSPARPVIRVGRPTVIDGMRSVGLHAARAGVRREGDVMPIVMGLDQHRRDHRRVAYTETGKVSRGRVMPAHRESVRRSLSGSASGVGGGARGDTAGGSWSRSCGGQVPVRIWPSGGDLRDARQQEARQERSGGRQASARAASGRQAAGVVDRARSHP